MENIIIITDPNKDPDDLISFAIAGYLQQQKIIDIKAIITTAGDYKIRYRRALCAKGAFLSLGVDVPVGVGIDYPFASEANEKHEKSFAEVYRSLTYFLNASKNKVEREGESFLLRQVQQAKDKSLTFVLIAGMRDFYNLALKHPDLVKKKTKKVSIMGGVLVENDQITADPIPTNNIMDIEAAGGTYNILAELKIPTVIIHKQAVYQARIPNDFYAGLKETNHFLGRYLYETQKHYVQSLFKVILEGKELKNKTKEWFFTQFTDLPPDCKEMDPEEIWKHTRYTYLYDPMTLLAALPEYKKLFKERQVGPFIFKYPENRYQMLEKIYQLTVRALK